MHTNNVQNKQLGLIGYSAQQYISKINVTVQHIKLRLTNILFLHHLMTQNDNL